MMALGNHSLVDFSVSMDLAIIALVPSRVPGQAPLDTPAVVVAVTTSIT